MIGGVATLTALVLVVLSNRWLELWQLSAAQGTSSMAPALPACRRSNESHLVTGRTS